METTTSGNAACFGSFRLELKAGELHKGDHRINAAIKRLRLALGDSADEPHYVETVARRGYRLTVTVEWVRDPEAGRHTGSELEPETSAQANLIGRKLSHYQVLEVLGGGG